MHSARSLNQISRDVSDRSDSRVAHRPGGIAGQCRPPQLFFRTGILLAALACTAVCGLSGCGYMLGNAFEPEIHTVHIPVFASNTDRRGIEFMVTEAIHREVKQRSSLRLAKPPNAQTRLTGRIVDVRKDALGETRFDDTRELQLQLAVQVRWEDLRTGEVLAQQRIPLPANLRQLVATAEFAPEIGQSLATANNRAVRNLAAQVVDMMELPW